MVKNNFFIHQGLPLEFKIENILKSNLKLTIQIVIFFLMCKLNYFNSHSVYYFKSINKYFISDIIHLRNKNNKKM